MYRYSNAVHQYYLLPLFVLGLCTVVHSGSSKWVYFFMPLFGVGGGFHPPCHCMCIVSTTTFCSVECVFFQHSLTVHACGHYAIGSCHTLCVVNIVLCSMYILYV